MTLLEINNIGKSYRKYASEWHRVFSWFMSVKPLEELSILKDITFSVTKGEAVGIVGKNGAGKSTLLKMISGTLKPTYGEIKANGNISAILELGMGFNPELTGRQNALHSLGLMGCDREESYELIPFIESFSEVGDYFDQPVRTYSSGMQVRVAFSVATAKRPEILIVDEALSVGDSYFQHKSFDRIRSFQDQGTTLLIVSHDRASIQSLCNRAILLHDGAILKDGEPEMVMDFYNALLSENDERKIDILSQGQAKSTVSSGTGAARVKSIKLVNSNMDEVDTLDVGAEVSLKVIVEVYQTGIENLVFGYQIKDRLGQIMYGINTWHTKQVFENPNSGDLIEYVVSFPVNFGPGSYSISTALHSADTHMSDNYEWKDRQVIFNIINSHRTFFVGVCWNEPTIICKRIISE